RAGVGGMVRVAAEHCPEGEGDRGRLAAGLLGGRGLGGHVSTIIRQNGADCDALSAPLGRRTRTDTGPSYRVVPTERSVRRTAGHAGREVLEVPRNRPPLESGRLIRPARWFVARVVPGLDQH